MDQLQIRLGYVEAAIEGEDMLSEFTGLGVGEH